MQQAFCHLPKRHLRKVGERVAVKPTHVHPWISFSVYNDYKKDNGNKESN